MNVAIVASEAAPFAKTGGLADVIGSLPKYLAELGHDVRVFVPKYLSVEEGDYNLHYEATIGEMVIRLGRHERVVHVQTSTLPGSSVPIYFVDCPHYYFRRYIYTMDPDEHERFILLCKAVIESCQRMRWKPDVVHCNDWQTGLLPVYLKDNYNWDRMFDQTATVYSIHNIAYQGRFSESAIGVAELRREDYRPGGPVEFHNSVSFMKLGILYSELITTVSHTYAREILTPEFGLGMESVLIPRAADLRGVLNGIDAHVWNPNKNSHIPYPYTSATLGDKEENKKFLLSKTTLPYDPERPLIGIVSRMVKQKGFDLFAQVAAELMLLDAQWVVLGSGEDRFEQMFQSISHSLPHKMWSYIGYSNELAHLIEAGADIFLMPSLYEPCGLNQMYSLAHGTVPIVRRTGGLADTVLDIDHARSLGRKDGNGFSFDEPSGVALFSTVRRAIEYYRNQTLWKEIQKNGMNADHSWERSAETYSDLYAEAKSKKLGRT